VPMPYPVNDRVYAIPIRSIRGCVAIHRIAGSLRGRFNLEGPPPARREPMASAHPRLCAGSPGRPRERAVLRLQSHRDGPPEAHVPLGAPRLPSGL
jgi:hypothetical protein